jgi:hypothetical protein
MPRSARSFSRSVLKMQSSCPRLALESWIYGYDPETKQQSSRWKSLNSPRPKNAKQVKSKVKSMLIIFFDIRGIVHKELVLADQTVNSTYCCDV